MTCDAPTPHTGVRKKNQNPLTLEHMHRMAAEPRKKRENCCGLLENVHRRPQDEWPLMRPRRVSGSLQFFLVEEAEGCGLKWQLGIFLSKLSIVQQLLWIFFLQKYFYKYNSALSHFYNLSNLSKILIIYTITLSNFSKQEVNKYCKYSSYINVDLL